MRSTILVLEALTSKYESALKKQLTPLLILKKRFIYLFILLNFNISFNYFFLSMYNIYI